MSDGAVAGPPWEVVEHTADWALRVRGRDWESLLRNAALGMASLLVGGEGPPAVDAPAPVEIAVDAPDSETLLVDWLTELAYLAESEGRVVTRVDFHDVARHHLRATVIAGQASLQKHIKAVTYHNLEIRTMEAGLEVTIVFDV